MKIEQQENDYAFTKTLKKDAIQLRMAFRGKKFAKTFKFEDFSIEIQKTFDSVENIFLELKDQQKITVDIINGILFFPIKAIRNNNLVEITSIIKLDELEGENQNVKVQNDDMRIEPLKILVETMRKEINDLKEQIKEVKIDQYQRMKKMEEEIKQMKQKLEPPISKIIYSDQQFSEKEFNFHDVNTVIQEARKFIQLFSKIQSSQDSIKFRYNCFQGLYKGGLQNGKPSGLGLLYSNKKKQKDRKWRIYAEWKNGQFHGKVLEDFPRYYEWSQYDKGKRHGKKIDFHNGKLESEHNYENGSLVGNYRFYKEDGSIREEGIYQNRNKIKTSG